jgi:hypothetical protein
MTCALDATYTEDPAVLRHAAELTSEVEIEVFLRSTALLVRYHAWRPLARIIRTSFPENSAGREIWITGSVSPRARTQLERLGWMVHAEAEAALDLHAAHNS